MHRTTGVVLVIGAVITGALASAAWMVHDGNEDRILERRTREAASVLTASLPNIRRPLTSAVVLADSNDAQPAAIERLLGSLVGEQGQFVSVSVWPLDAPEARPILTIGPDPALVGRPPEDARAMLVQAEEARGLAVIDLLDHDPPYLGYAVVSPVEPRRFVLYAESALPADRRAPEDPDNPFSGLDNAVYLGSEEADDRLLLASTDDLPIEGRRATEEVEFGDTTLLLVMTPTEELGGRLLGLLPWLVLGAGLLTALGAGVLVERLQRRRDHAVELAKENRRLYAEQRSVAAQLQQSILPDRLPEVPGLALAARYEAGTAGLDVGGDWYDAIPLDDDRVLLVVGDVSGRGLDAATVMASLRHAIRAFASIDDDPAEILERLCRLVSVGRDGHFATVLLALADVPARRLCIANAGHPAPLLIDSEGVRFIATDVGPPVGAGPGSGYRTVELELEAGATVLAFTDGLFERRGEVLDAGMERLQAATGAALGTTLAVRLDQILDELIPTGADDDTAILGLQWRA